jgi:hypothetical protein
MKTFLELYDDLKEKSKGLYYNINKKRKEGRPMRKKGEKGAPREGDFERAAQTAKEQLYDKIGPTAKLMKPILVKPKPLGTAPKLGGQTKRGQMVRPKPPKLPESEVQDVRDRKRRANLSFNQQIQTAKRIDDRNKERKKREQEQEKARQQRQTQREEAPSLAVLKKKIKSGTKLGSTETASAKARGLIPRADGTKRKSPKYK